MPRKGFHVLLMMAAICAVAVVVTHLLTLRVTDSDGTVSATESVITPETTD